MQTSLSDDMTLAIDSQKIASMEKRYRVNLVNSLSGFKSANLIGTRSIEGQNNLAIFSSAFHLGADPAYIGMISRPDNGERHTLNNISETGVYTINHVSQVCYEKAHQTSARYEKEISEFDKVGLEPEFLDGFSAPYVASSPVKIGLTLVDIVPIRCNDTCMIIGEVKFVYLPKAALHDDGFVDIESAGSVAVSGLDSYHKTQKLDRLSYAKPDRILKTVT